MTQTYVVIDILDAQSIDDGLTAALALQATKTVDMLAPFQGSPLFMKVGASRSSLVDSYKTSLTARIINANQSKPIRR